MVLCVTQYKLPPAGMMKKIPRWTVLTNGQKSLRSPTLARLKSSNLSVLPLSLNLIIFLFPKDSNPCVHSAYMAVR